MELPYHDPRSVFLDDVTYELSILIEQRPLSERKGHQVEPFGYAAYDDMLNMLGSLDCQYMLGFVWISTNTA